MMKKVFAILVLFAVGVVSFAQQKYALVIGNGAYAHITKLNNPVNDANDVAAALQSLGFTVDKLLNASQEQMESGAIRLKNRLSSSKNSYGFLFYAGHGVQSGGENYLIPVDANIQSESFLRQRAVSVQAMLDELNDAGNELNMVVLDACRDNPFSWKRSGTRGLTIVGQQPADSIIVFATSAGSTAADGTGRNGLFTGHFLNHLKTPGLEVNEVFRRTMGDVARDSGNQQRPAVYNQFAGIAYFGAKPAPAPTPQPTPAVTSTPQPVVTPQSAPTQPAVPAAAPTPAIVPQPAPMSSQSFEMDGTVLVKYHGNQANVTIPAGVTVIGEGAFLNRSNIARITIPASVTTIGDQAFDGCERLIGITIPANVMSIGFRAFANCEGLTSITIPASVTSIGGSAFIGCKTLTSITISTSSQLKSIGGNAFDSCSIKNITIPASVTSIGSYAFSSWTFSQTINIQGKANQAEADRAWGSDWRANCKAKIKYSK